MNSYVFLLCPPLSGSTVLWNLISTSNAVSSLPREGQFLPEVKEVMRQDPWNPDVKLPWKKIKEVWDGYWDQDKPLLVEKSPPHIIRASEIAEYFNPVYFLLMVRNPYAHCESFIRRHRNVKEAVEFTVRCLRQQAENADKLNNTLVFTYEELAGNPEIISRKIQSFIPQIGVLKHRQSFKVHSFDGAIERGIVDDLNKKKISNLSVNDLEQINKVLKRNSDVMDYWGYKYYEPSLQHAFTFLRTRSGAFLATTSSRGRGGAARLFRRLTRR
jgi:hypothetical protein